MTASNKRPTARDFVTEDFDEVTLGKTKTHLSINKHRKLILEGKVLYVDPATGSGSCPGYAVTEEGILIDNGILEPTKAETSPYRLHQIVTAIQLYFPDCQLLVIEGIRKNLGLIHSVGAIKAALGVPMIEVFPRTWRKYAGAAYCSWKSWANKNGVSSDAEDARKIQEVTVAIARSFNRRY